MSVAEELSFGPFRLSVRRRTLASADGPVVLSSRAFDVLLALIEAREAPIGKDALMKRVWGDIFVEENNLHVQIAAIRRAVGPEHILTLPGRGYRFVSPVAEGEAVAAFPAPSPPPPDAAGNLPLQLTALIGRQIEMADVEALLGRARLVTLVGPGGVGKTKLALTAASTLQERFPDGCWLVELGALADPALAASALAASLRVEELRDRPLSETLIAWLRPRALLLVIDGCEHVLGAAADLIGDITHRCPSVRLLCTSQTPLGVEGEHVRRLAPLETPTGEFASVDEALACDAVQLFVERAGAGDSRFALTEATLPSVVEICRILEGVPLALELAAARVPLLGLEPVRQRIGGRLALLGDDRQDTPQRHRTLRATIEWSHGLLPEQAKEILRRLSIFAGGFTLEAAQQVAAGAGIAEWDIVRGVGDLVRRSMLANGPDMINPRHRMLETMRAFALETLDAAGEREVIARKHAEHFCRLAEAAEARWETGGDLEWTALLSPELENLRAALEWALGDAGAPRLGAQLAAATARFWFEASLLSEGRAWLTRALERAPEDLDAASLVRLQRGLADLSLDAVSAARTAEAAVSLAETLGEPETLGACLRTLAAARYRMADYPSAQALAERAARTLDPQTQPRTFAECLGDLCILRGVAGDHAEARRLNEQAQARLQALGDRRRAAICLQYAAEFEFADGQADAAEALGAESVALFRLRGGRYHLGIGLGNLAAYRLARRDAAGAAEAGREALAIAAEIDDEAGVVIGVETLALALSQLGALEDAARLSGFVEAAYARLGLSRQETERAIHAQLASALAGLPAAPRLAEQGAMLDAVAAARFAQQAARSATVARPTSVAV